MADLVFLGSVDSTNDTAIDAAREGAPHGYAVAADEQTAGRGRRGHGWTSRPGGLYLSCVLRPGVPMSSLVALPALAAMGVVDALRGVGLGGCVGIKWPNDVVARTGERFDRKLAGVLVEARSAASGAFAVAGVGVNLAPVPAEQDPAHASAGAPPLAPVSLAELADAAGVAELPGRDELAALVRDAVLARVDAWVAALGARPAAGPLAPVLSEYFDMVPMMGRAVAVVDPAGCVVDTGCLTGVDVWGRATVRTPAGRELVLPAEAASLREVF